LCVRRNAWSGQCRSAPTRRLGRASRRHIAAQRGCSAAIAGDEAAVIGCGDERSPFSGHEQDSSSTPARADRSGPRQRRDRSHRGPLHAVTKLRRYGPGGIPAAGYVTCDGGIGSRRMNCDRSRSGELQMSLATRHFSRRISHLAEQSAQIHAFGPARRPDRPRVRQIVRAAIAFESDGPGHAPRCGFSAVMICLRLDPSPVRQDLFAGESGLTRRQTGYPVKRCGWVRTLLGSFAAPAYFSTGERLGKTQLSPRKKAEGAG